MDPEGHRFLSGKRAEKQPQIWANDSKKVFDPLQGDRLCCVREFETGPAIERAAAERRGSRVLTSSREFTGPTAETGSGFFVIPLPDGPTQ
jgi:hypothetical protein